MPTTINGIGTMYYGRRNLRTRFGACERCGKAGDLRSYETRLWFTIVYVPIIPMGRKQIIDHCWICARYRIMPLGKWRELVSRQLDETREKMARSSQDEQAALEHLHAVCDGGAAEEADRLARELPRRFPNSADVQMAVGNRHQVAGRGDEAEKCFAAALRMDPDSEEARRAVGIGLIEKGQLAEARKMLAFLEEPGANQDAQALMLLGKAHQERGDHDQALDLFAKAAKGSPAIVRDRQFRRMVKRSQASAPGGERILPRVPLLRRRGVVIGAVLAAVIAVPAGINYWIATHQTLHVINGLSVPVVVRIDGSDGFTVSPGGRKKIALVEGRHQAVVTPQGSGSETVEFTMATSWFDRFLRSPVFILNAGRGAIVLWEEATYTEFPIGTPARQELHVGKAFVAFKDIDYIFEPLPQNIEAQEDSPSSTRTGVAMLAVAPAAFLSDQGPFTPQANDLMAYAEGHLRASPQDNPLLWQYVALAGRVGRIERCREFLAGGLSARPLRFEWHNMYQDLCEGSEFEEQMLQRYRRLVKDEPKNSAALCLLGRITLPNTEAMGCYDRAIKADPENPYAYLGKGFRLMSAADFAAARDALAKACRLCPDHPTMVYYLYQARFALKEYAKLEAEAREQLKADLLNPDALTVLLEVLVARGKAEVAEQELRGFEKLWKAERGTDPGQVLLASRLYLLYFTGDFSGLARESRSLENAAGVRAVRIQCDLELGHVDELARRAGEAKAPPYTAHQCLLISISYGLKKEKDKADLWRAKARELLAAAGANERFAAKLLESAEALQIKDARDLAMPSGQQAMVLVALAQACPKHKAELLALAGKLNFRLSFPHHFLKRAIAAMK